MKLKKIISLGLLLAGAISLASCTNSGTKTNTNITPTANKPAVTESKNTDGSKSSASTPQSQGSSSAPSTQGGVESTQTTQGGGTIQTNPTVPTTPTVVTDPTEPTVVEDNEKIKVTFYVDGVSSYVEVEKGSKVSKPASPKKDGFEFAGWYTTATFENGTLYNFNSVINNELELYAKWVEVDDSVEYEKIGFGSKYTKWATLFENSTRKNKDRPYMGANDTDEINVNGFTFLGKALLESSILNTNASVIKINLPNNNSTIAMSATWASTNNVGKLRVYKEGTLIYESEETYSKSAASIELELNDLDSGTYEIKAEKTDAAGQAGLKVASIYYTKIIEYVNVEYVTNSDEVIDPAKVKKGNTIELPTLTKSDYKFEGWYTAASFSNDSLFSNNDKVEEDIKLYAKWTKLNDDEIAKVSFNVNVAGASIQPINIEKGTAILNMPVLDIEGYRFNGWFNDQAFQSAFDVNSVISADKVIYAEYIKIYSVQFLDKDGNEITTVVVDEDTLITESIRKPFVSGYKFEGWKLNGNLFDIENEKINSSLVLTASYVVNTDPVAKIAITKIEGLSESGYVTFNKYSDATDYNIYLDDKKLTNKNYYLSYNNSTVRVDLFGIKEGTHKVEIEPIIGLSEIADAKSNTSINVEAYDRSGYAHFNYNEGVGAYNDDGTLKDNAIVLYVTDDNKNDIKLEYKGKTVTGIGNILNSSGKEVSGGLTSKNGKANTNQGILLDLALDNIPLVVRFIGCVSDSGLYKNGSSFNAANESIIAGLSAYDSVDYGGTEGDNGHMARMQSSKNVTLEGVGSDAVIDGWGFQLIAQSSNPNLTRNFEVRNLKFINTPEDAIGMEGVQEDGALTASVERCWVHNCEFYCPNISKPAESDKSQGDGSVDFKRGQYFTCSYNYYEDCHKTNLIGASDNNLSFNLTYHHNYYYYCESRGPLTRKANVHMYNNVFFGQSSYAMNTRADAYIFSEYNLFYACKNPYKVEGGAIKAYNDVISSVIYNDGGGQTVVTDKSQKVNNNCSNGSIDYSSFDTDDKLSYIPSGNYYLQTDVTDAKKVVISRAGTFKDSLANIDTVSMSDISYLNAVVNNVTVNNLSVGTKESPNSVNVPSYTKTLYAFKIDEIAQIDISYDAAGVGVLCNEAGVALLTGNGSAILVPGIYFIQSYDIGAGSTAKPLEFRTVKITKFTLTQYDSEEYMAMILGEFNKAVSLIPTTIAYNDECYNAINNALNKYDSLSTSAKESAKENYNLIMNYYNQFKNLGIEYVENEINKIVTPITATNSSYVINARTEYNKLISRVMDANVTNYNKLEQAEELLKQQSVEIFIEYVNQLPATIAYNDECKNIINNALFTYNNLDEDSLKDNNVVTAYNKLMEAKSKFDSLEKVYNANALISNASSISDYEKAYNSYNELTSTEKENIVGINEMLVKYDIALIDTIPANISLSDGILINLAYNIYDGLSADDKLNVTNKDKLLSAKEAYDNLAASTIKWSYDGTYKSDLITATGNKGNGYTYGEDTYTSGLKLQSGAGKITFTLSTARTVIIYASKGNAIKINGKLYTITAGGATVIELEKGDYEIEKGDGEGLIHAIIIQ